MYLVHKSINELYDDESVIWEKIKTLPASNAA